MGIRASVTSFLNGCGSRTFLAPMGEDPVVALAARLGKEVSTVRQVVYNLTEQGRIWVRATKVTSGDEAAGLPPAIGLHGKQHKRRSMTVPGSCSTVIAPIPVVVLLEALRPSQPQSV